MDLPILTFLDIIKLNDFDWDRAYEVLNYHIDNGSLQKEIQPGEQVIYHNSSGIEKNQLLYNTLFSTQTENNKAKQPRRKRISRSTINGDI
ncbi:hypothetical protein JYB64_13330 [Algoriphagus aestuarii]|nr:hypothetical protein [Algoriphagus aestuarii]